MTVRSLRSTSTLLVIVSLLLSGVAMAQQSDYRLLMALRLNYEIARYGALISWAKQLRREDCAAVLHETLEEEKAADSALTNIAESQVNAEAEMSR